MMKKRMTGIATWAVFLMAMAALGGCGGGGGKSLDNVLVPSNTGASVTAFQNEDPEELVAKDAADITMFDTEVVTAFSGGTTISTSGATFLDMATCGADGCHAGNADADLNTYNSFLETNHNLAWGRKVASFTTYANGTPPRKYCVQCHSVTGPFIDTDGDHVFDAGEKAPFGLSPSSTAGTFGGQLGSASFTSVLDIADEFKGIQCENCHGPASLHNGDKTKIVTGFQAWGAKTCDPCHQQNEEWEKTGHATAREAAHGSSSCQTCHSGEGFKEYADYVTANRSSYNVMQFLAAGLRTITGDATDAATEGEGAHNVNCVACHDPHNKTNEHQLRLPKEQLCISCHNSRTKMALDSRAPHHNLQGRILNGQGLVRPDSKMLWSVGGKFICGSEENAAATDCPTGYAETVLTDIEPVMGTATCADCHMYSYTDRAAGIEWLGHTFKPRTETCQRCHTNMDAGNVIGVIQADFQVKYDALKVRMDRAMLVYDTNADGSLLATGSTADTYATNTTAFRKAQDALFNLHYVDYDGSKGFHNPNTAKRAFQYTDEILRGIGF